MPATIDIRLSRIAQLFESLDPSPFREKTLDPDAHRYLLACALELDPGQGLRVRLAVPDDALAAAADITVALHHHFRLELEQFERDLRRRTRQGRVALLVALVVLAACSLLRSLLPEALGGPTGFVGEGLLILGWVALWRPAEVLLYERWESREERRALSALSVAEVELRAAPPV